MTDKTLEEQIQEKGLTALRITMEHVQSLIKKEDYCHFPDTQSIVCCLVLENGFTVIGEYVCANPENFDVEIGETIAKKDAISKVEALEGYILKQKLFEQETTKVTFGQALEALKLGSQARRSGWDGIDIFIELQVPDANSKMTHPYIYIDTTKLQTHNPDAPKVVIPWLASQTDLLAEDWEIFT